MSGDRVSWPLLSNVIRGKSEHNTFGMVRKFANGSPKPHQGWDFSASIGTAVYAIGDGKVEFVRNHGDYGLQLCHSFEFEKVTYYAFFAHLKSSLVAAGATVKKGALIANTGNSGNASNLPSAEDHLHFEIRTSPSPGAGLAGRLSPLKIYKQCPLRAPVFKSA
jgi:murein DD-endopeptidase MepM/ murein hydrolase activator NlpD